MPPILDHYNHGVHVLRQLLLNRLLARLTACPLVVYHLVYRWAQPQMHRRARRRVYCRRRMHRRAPIRSDLISIQSPICCIQPICDPVSKPISYPISDPIYNWIIDPISYPISGLIFDPISDPISIGS
jgi:hypothetical protein